MDNFNWGVRRQSISRLEGTEEAGEVNVLFTKYLVIAAVCLQGYLISRIFFLLFTGQLIFGYE